MIPNGIQNALVEIIVSALAKPHRFLTERMCCGRQQHITVFVNALAFC